MAQFLLDYITDKHPTFANAIRDFNGDKFTRLVGRFCVKGLVHVVDDPEMDADIILGEDCIKFVANDTFYHQPQHRFVVSDVAADYDTVGMRKLSAQVHSYFPHYTLPKIATEIERLNITEVVQGTAPVDQIG